MPKTSKHHNVPDLLKHLHPDEPFFFIRAQDKLSVEAIKAYSQILHRIADEVGFNADLKEDVALSMALSLSDQATEVAELAVAFEEWQKANPDKVKYPD